MNDSPPEPIDAREFAKNVRELLSEDPQRYRLFGQYWFFVKRLLKRFYDEHQMPILRDFDDPSVSARIPAEISASGESMLRAAATEYLQNATFNMGRNDVTDSDGDWFMLLDPDIDG